MIDKLSYQLTTGVTTTREGLVIRADINPIAHYVLDGPELVSGPKCVIPWPDAADRLRYRENEPFCMYDEMYNDIVLREPSAQDSHYQGRLFLHRLAAILCDDAVAFRVLYWCLTEYGDKDD